ncbi:MAG: malate synthase A [Rickettsiales bacterium]
MPYAASQTPASTLMLTDAVPAPAKHLFTPEALAFVGDLVEKFGARREELLAKRAKRQKEFDTGKLPDFLPETKAIRESEWKVAPIPEALLDRRVEITGPAEPKMIINALNSGAKVFMADLEDSLSPTWEKAAEGQAALYDAMRRTLTFKSPEGKEYKLGERLATLIVRPRGWHLPEKHVLHNGKPISGSLFDFGMFFFHNAAYAAEKKIGPFFYIPKLESHEEAQLWADVFAYSEKRLGIPHGSIKATVLIEVITAVFEMDEILHALKDYCAGLNCGRWDYIYSFIKKFHARPEFVLPERGQVTMTTHFLKSYSELLIKTCHRREAFAMGGMSAFIPVKNDEAANEKAFAAVRADKEREASAGHDGTWVAHPGLIPVAMEVFDRLMPGKNQVDKKREDVKITAADLIKVPEGTVTEAGLRNNASVSIQYTAAWLSGNGCVPINNLMEDAATAEISRTQLWQWVHHPKGKLDTGADITADFIKKVIAEELEKIKLQIGDKTFDNGNYDKAAGLIEKLTLDKNYTEFLTLPAYEMLA